jgi:hypothetical protein
VSSPTDGFVPSLGNQLTKKHFSYIPPKWGAKTTILLDHTNILTRKKIKKEYANKIQQGKITKEIKKGKKDIHNPGPVIRPNTHTSLGHLNHPRSSKTSTTLSVVQSSLRLSPPSYPACTSQAFIPSYISTVL